MPKQELLVPANNIVSLPRRESGIITVDVPGSHHRGLIEATFTKWSANYNARAVESLTRLKNSQAALVAANTHVIEESIKNRAAQALFAELPERLGHELAVRRVQRAEEFRAVQHRYELNEEHRGKDLTLAEAEHTHARATLTHARTTLVDADQQLRAQKEHGYFNYALAHKKKTAELLDLELSEQEKRALLKRSLRELDDDSDLLPEDESEIDDALYARREQLDAAGLDSSRIDAVIKSRRKQ